jgi:hypothetical protein
LRVGLFGVADGDENLLYPDLQIVKVQIYKRAAATLAYLARVSDTHTRTMHSAGARTRAGLAL